eukprot:60186_1
MMILYSVLILSTLQLVYTAPGRVYIGISYNPIFNKDSELLENVEPTRFTKSSSVTYTNTIGKERHSKTHNFNEETQTFEDFPWFEIDGALRHPESHLVFSDAALSEEELHDRVPKSLVIGYTFDITGASHESEVKTHTFWFNDGDEILIQTESIPTVPYTKEYASYI